MRSFSTIVLGEMHNFDADISDEVVRVRFHAYYEESNSEPETQTYTFCTDINTPTMASHNNPILKPRRNTKRFSF